VSDDDIALTDLPRKLREITGEAHHENLWPSV
jgi:hypothetical protein